MKRLLLEGGAQRSLFTAGVLDCFMDHGIKFDEVYGVSAGCLIAVGYLSNDRGRALKQTILFTGDKRYISAENRILRGSAFDWDFLFNGIPKNYLPFDVKTYKNCGMTLYAVAFECETGKNVAFPVKDINDPKDQLYLQATCSLPLFTQVCPIGDKHYSDGGVGDSFGLHSCPDDGGKTVLVMTRQKGFRKKVRRIPHYYLYQIYRDYPLLAKHWDQRSAEYNSDLDLIEKREEEGSMFVIRPDFEVTVSRTEQDRDKLAALYLEGYRIAEEQVPAMKEYLEK